MDFDAALKAYTDLYTQYGHWVDAWLLIFFRVLAFVTTAPVLNRKDIPFNIKLAFAVFIAGTLLFLVPITPGTGFHMNTGIFLMILAMNIVVGALIGFMADVVVLAVSATGSMITNQIGLSSAMIFDPSQRQQVMILDRVFGLLGTIIFIQIGGFFWLINALERSFDVFPLFSATQDIVGKIDLSYLTQISANTIIIAVQLAAPVLIVTLAIDSILGIVNRTAQQMPVFQLSFAIKPSIGVAVLLATMPILIQNLINYFKDYSQFF